MTTEDLKKLAAQWADEGAKTVTHKHQIEETRAVSLCNEIIVKCVGDYTPVEALAAVGAAYTALCKMAGGSKLIGVNFIRDHWNDGIGERQRDDDCFDGEPEDD